MPTIGQMIANDESPDEIRDAIISSLYSKAAERVEAAKPYVVSNIFDDDVDEEEYVEEDEYDEDEDEE
jgi:hypothetical protein